MRWYCQLLGPSVKQFVVGGTTWGTLARWHQGPSQVGPNRGCVTSVIAGAGLANSKVDRPLTPKCARLKSLPPPLLFPSRRCLPVIQASSPYKCDQSPPRAFIFSIFRQSPAKKLLLV